MATKSKKAPALKKSAAPKKQNSTLKGTSGKLQELLEDGIKDLYWAEKALTKAIPKMIKNATSEELSEALDNHLEETQVHVQRLEEIFGLLEKKPQAKKCEAMAGLIKEAEELMSEHERGVMRDAAIISAGQKVEHYEIASYGTLKAYAEIIGQDEIAGLLEQTLEEEKMADEKLTEVTPAAIMIEEDEEAEEE